MTYESAPHFICIANKKMRLTKKESKEKLLKRKKRGNREEKQHGLKFEHNRLILVETKVIQINVLQTHTQVLWRNKKDVMYNTVDVAWVQKCDKTVIVDRAFCYRAPSLPQATLVSQSEGTHDIAYLSYLSYDTFDSCLRHQ